MAGPWSLFWSALFLLSYGKRPKSPKKGHSFQRPNFHSGRQPSSSCYESNFGGVNCLILQGRGCWPFLVAFFSAAVSCCLNKRAKSAFVNLTIIIWGLHKRCCNQKYPPTFNEVLRSWTFVPQKSLWCKTVMNGVIRFNEKPSSRPWCTKLGKNTLFQD